jgi:hypothetical protein
MRKGSESQKQHLLVMIETAQQRGCDEGQITAMMERELGLTPKQGEAKHRPGLTQRLLGLGVDRRAA